MGRRCKTSYFKFAFSRARLVLVLLLAAAAFPALSRAQQVATATINGTVTDATGAVVPGAQVTLQNTATNVQSSTSTNTSGYYTLLNILPGRYTLTVSKTGFKTITQASFDLAVNQTTSLDFTLQVGETTQKITVEAVAGGIQTSTSELGTVITTRSVTNLPLNGRNFTQMLNLTPGVSTVNVSQNAGNQQFQGNPVGTFSFPSINGQSNRSNFFLVDGLNDEESFNSTYTIPPIVDDIQEFKVDSHNDQAQFGGVLGGVVNVVTKSGTNQLHGTAWEFLRNNSLDARGPFDTETSQLQQNQFGFNVGGPVILPHYNGRDRTFFFGSYEGVRIHSGNFNQSLIPTPQEINGDFTADGVTIYNPYSTSSSGTGARVPFQCDSAGNPIAPDLTPGPTYGTQALGTDCAKIPTALIDPNMQKVAQMMYGNFKLAPIPGTNRNYQQAILNTQSPNIYNIRIDEQLSQKDAIWGRFSHMYSPRNVPGIFGQVNQNAYWAHTIGINWNHTFGPSAILTVQFGRNYGFSANPTLLPEATSQALVQAGNWAQSFTCGFKDGPRDCYFIGVNFSDGGFASFTEGTSPAVISDIWQWKGNFTKILGKHNLSMGADFNTNGFQQTFNSGHLDFSNAQTASAVSGGSGGLSLASYLLGVPNTLNKRNVFETEYGGWVDGFYFQDQWRVNNRLTLNLGGRYDVTFLPIFGSAKDGNAPVGNMDYNNGTYVIQFMPGACNSTLSNPPCIPNGTLPQHVTVSPNGHFWDTAYDNIQPRVGAAYRLRQKTVLRASFGRFFDNWAAVTQMAQNQQGVWPSVGQISNRPLNQDNGPPTTFAEDPGVGLFLDPTPFRQSIWFVDPNLKNPYSWQWNFGAQQALSPDTTLTVNYVGSTSHRLDVGVQGNQALQPGPGPAPNGCMGLDPSVCADNSADVAAEGRWLWPYLATNHWDRSIGKGWYNALQVSLDKKTNHGFSYLVSYTWSKVLSLGTDSFFGTGGSGTSSVQNPYKLAGDKGLAGFDLPQILTMSWVYQLPFGTGGRFQSGSRALDWVVGGWQLNGIASITSGSPYNVTASSSIPNVGTTGISERADLCGNPVISNPTPAQWFNNAVAIDSGGNVIPGTCTSNGAFAVPLSFTYGNFGRNVLRGDGRANFDLSIFRSFQITESKRLEFRAESFNFTNSPIWGFPGSNISSNFSTNPTKNTFGVVTGTGSGYAPRQLQFGLKFYF